MATFTAQSDNNGNYTLRLTVTENGTDVAANTSEVFWALYIDSTYARFEDYNTTAAVTLDGAAVYSDTSYRSMPVTRGESLLLGSGTAAVAHDADGGKCLSVTYSIAMDAVSYTPGSVSGSGTMDLTAIPRASAVSCGSFTMGTAGSITVSAASDSFTHTVRYAFGSASGTIASGVKGGTVKWTPPLALAGQLPAASTGTGALTCTTYSGGTAVGTVSCTFTAYVPASVTPVISAFTVLPVNASSVLSGVYVRDFTRMQYAVTAAGQYGASVVSCTVTAGSVSGTGTAGTTGTFSAAGSVSPTATVKDSRGRTTVKKLDAVTVYDYAAPTVSSFAAARCTSDGTLSDSGTCLRVVCRAACSSVGGRNTAVVKARWKLAGGSYGSSVTLTDTVAVIGGSLLTTRSYVLEVAVTDALGGSKTIYSNIPTTAVTVNFRDGGTGIGVGKYAEDDGMLDVAWNARFRGAASFDVPAVFSGGLTGTAGKRLLELTMGGNFTGDADTLHTPGCYWCMNTCTHLPAADWMYLLVLANTVSDNCVQAAFTYTGGVYYRLYVNRAWSAWHTVSTT